MSPESPLWSNPRKLALAAALVAALVCFFLLVTSQSPRGRLNVMQFVSALFFVLVIARRWTTQAGGPADSDASWRSYNGLLLALAVGAGVWAFTLPVGFINDDFGLLYGAREPGLARFWEFIQSQSGVFFRPLGYASIFLDYRLWQQWAPGYHLTNIALHLAAIAGLYCLCGHLGFKTETAATASLIYAVLPVHAEAVTWIGCRFVLLSDALMIGAAILYLKSRNQDGKRGGWVSYGAALVCFVLAALSKETAFVLPVLLLLAELLILPNRRFRPVLGFFLAAVALFAGRWWALGGIGGYAASTGQAATFDIGFKTFEGLLIRAPAIMLFGYNWLQPPLGAVIVLASFTAAFVLVTAWLARKETLERGPVVFSLAWMGLAILPAHPLLMIGAGLTNSRNLHLGAMGLALLLAQVMTKAVPGRTRRLLVLPLIGLLSLASLHNLAAWRWTSQLTQQVLSEAQRMEPDPAPNTEFIFYNLPETVRGVFLLHESLSEALRITHGRDDLSARHVPGLPPEPAGGGLAQRPVVRMEWLGEMAPLLRRLPDSVARY